MATRRGRWRRGADPDVSGRSERGAVLVEAALILPVLLLLMAGIIDYALAFNGKLTVSSATRAGARTGSAAPRTSTFFTGTQQAVEKALSNTSSADTPQELWIYRANASGVPYDQSSMTCVGSWCRKYTWSIATKTFSISTGGTNWSTQDSCTEGGSDADGEDIESMGVYLKVQHKYIFGGVINNSTGFLTDRTIARLEPTPPGQLGCP